MSRWKGPLFLFLAFSLAGTSVIAARFVSEKLGTFTITAVSLFAALLILIPASGKKLLLSLSVMSIKSYLLIVLQAVFGIFLFRCLLLYGLLYTGSIEAGILTGATPAITAIFAMLFLKEAPTSKKLIGVVSTVIGILLIQGILIHRLGFSGTHLVGNLLVLCAAACESIFNILSRAAVIRDAAYERAPINPLLQTTIVTVIALLLCVIPALFESPFQRLAKIGYTEWLALFWYGLFVTALAFVFWYAGIKRCEAFTAAAFSGMMPFTSMLLSVIVLREQAGWLQWLGGLLVIVGMVLIGTGSSPGMHPILHRKRRRWVYKNDCNT